MKRYRIFFLTLLVILALTACSAGGGAVSTSAVASQGSTEANSKRSGVEVTPAASTVTNAAAAVVEAAESHTGAGDYEVDLASAASVTFNGDSITASGSDG